MLPFLFPHLGPYQVYDNDAYTWLSSDEARTSRLHTAIKEHAAGKVVVDIGTGRDVNWACAAVAAGATKAYAIEWSSSTFALAKQTVHRLGLEDRIVLIHGNSLAVDLPEKADLIVAETIGDIGSAEGQWALMQDARRRFLREGGVVLPRRCITRVAATALPRELHGRLRLSSEGAVYTARIFELIGRPFDLRLSIANFDPRNVMSTSGTFEDLNFQAPAPQPLSYTNESVLTIERSGRMDGLVLWLELYFGSSENALDSLHESTSWYPAFLPIFYPGIEVLKGDRLCLRCTSVLSDDGLHPDYVVSGELRRAGAALPFSYTSLHHGVVYRGDAFFQELFSL